jgi:hypothetical protein
MRSGPTRCRTDGTGVVLLGSHFVKLVESSYRDQLAKRVVLWPRLPNSLYC